MRLLLFECMFILNRHSVSVEFKGYGPQDSLLKKSKYSVFTLFYYKTLKKTWGQIVALENNLC